MAYSNYGGTSYSGSWNRIPMDTTQSNTLNQYTGLLSNYMKPMEFSSTALPPAPEPVTANLPQYSMGRERMLQQQKASPTMSKLNRGLLQALQYARARGNSPSINNAVRDALSGYGEGLSGAMSGALGQAISTQNAQLHPQIAEAVFNANQQAHAKNLDYQAQLNQIQQGNQLKAQDMMNQRSGLLSMVGRTVNQSNSPTSSIIQRPPMQLPYSTQTPITQPNNIVSGYGQPDTIRDNAIKQMTSWTPEMDSEFNRRFGGGVEWQI